MKIDGYWLRMGGLLVEAIDDCLTPDVTGKQQEVLAEYMGGLLENAYEMGVRLGEARGRFARNYIDTKKETNEQITRPD
jgi:hypothetical protein